jgi:dTDP-4-dehydrorhamnose reductase
MAMKKEKVLILGGSGMLGHVIFNSLSLRPDFDVYATVRDPATLEKWFSSDLMKKIIAGVEADDFDTVIRAMALVQPDIIINCIGLIKQLPIADAPLSAIAINSLLPHRIARACGDHEARMIHVSTDCVFDGSKGNYTENDPSDAKDLYGRSKFLGEVAYPHCVTLRTSIIGHELKGKLGLIEWFLVQQGSVRGFKKAIYSGFPTVELARIICDYVMPNPELNGVYHVSSEPVSKYELLKLVAERYGKRIEIEPFEDFVLDRSLDSTSFQKATGYQPPLWTELIDAMYKHYVEFGYGEKSLAS